MLSKIFKKNNPAKEKGVVLIGIAIAAGVVGLIGGIAYWYKDSLGYAVLGGAGSLVLGIARFFLNMSANLLDSVGGATFIQQPITGTPWCLPAGQL